MIKRLEEIESNNPTEYWKLIKELKERKAQKRISNPEEFEEFFRKLFADEKDDSNPSLSSRKKEIAEKVTQMMNEAGEETGKEYSLDEMKRAINKLKANKSSMLIPAEMLKASPNYILIVLLKIINRIKHRCYFP